MVEFIVQPRGMMSSFDSIDEALNIESEIVPTPKGEKNELKKVNGVDVDKDYDYTRGNLYSLIEKGQEAINGIMELSLIHI